MRVTASILDRLLDDDPRVGDPRVGALDLTAPAKLAGKLKSDADALSRHIREQFLPEAREILDSYSGSTPEPQELVAALVEGLNRVIMGPFLYERQRFAGVRLAQDTLKTVEEGGKGANVVYLNRMLLERAYTDDLQKMRPYGPPSQTLHELIRSVSRDLEWLLNTRRELLDEAAPPYKEIKKSMLMYGLPDMTGYSLLSNHHRRLMRLAVEEALKQFEPRLKSVRITLEQQGKYDQAVRFRIEALLRVDPTPEPVSFNVQLHLSTSQYTVHGEA
jgi:type VI secretion system protein ImpF